MPKLVKKRVVEEEKKPVKVEKAEKPEKKAIKAKNSDALPPGFIYTVLAEFENRWHTIILTAESEKDAKKKAKPIALKGSTILAVAKGYKYTVIDTTEDARKIVMLRGTV